MTSSARYLPTKTDGDEQVQERMSISMTPGDRALIESAAKAAGFSVSTWVVHTAREEARWAIARQIADELAAEAGVTDEDFAWAASVLGVDPDSHSDAKHVGELLRATGSTDTPAI